ncbi:MAG: DedA family protein [Hyphomicrobiaceae bacterium]|nr:DedA family protein [Hyphomicrobiaceae bacterium]
METALTLAGLTLWAFLAATILPLSSEAALWAAIKATTISKPTLLISAIVGNVAGATFNWWLGHLAIAYRDHKQFPISKANLDLAAGRFQRWGKWSLLLSWVPIAGDPLTLAAGLFRVPFWQFLGLVTVGRAARYVVVAYGFA